MVVSLSPSRALHLYILFCRGPAAVAAAAPAKPSATAPSRSRAVSTTLPGAAAKRPRPVAVAEQAGPADDDDSALSRDTLSREDAEAKLGELFGDEVVEGLNSAKWKTRLETMDGVLSKVFR